ncbi:biotin/lipoyl-binding protein [Pelotomaculum isophthalicicum JI]|uniref:Biotin/lipoyl-binding protein n=1 Tax=Pelotomaculum isophthalicicum JI TaxID=947010 RepID=A0A9X4GXI8_9FIRM|nr:biotin/lipoyl-containing protein [Pelotomaculum isophthalicicum]MDF9406830.1 biotin/lipoyl-binding protein [Pelotomaculum isophthalicicum JI]
MKKFRVTVNGEVYEVEIEEVGGSADSPTQLGAPVPPRTPEAAPLVSASAPIIVPGARNASSLSLGDAGTVTSPMPGMINDVKVKTGDQVKPGDVLIVLEAMKMENLIKADIAGTVKEVRVVKGQAVNGGDPLAVIA